MERKEKAKAIKDILDRLYPDPPIPLYHTNPFTLCIAVLLSAHTTDKSVNSATPTLFSLADNPADMVKLGPERIREIIRKVGLSNTKSRNVWNLSRILLEKHGGELPRTWEDLEALPGVGHKTASVVMSQAYRVPAFPVDTHIHRLAERWGLSTGRNVEQTERDLKEVFPESAWNRLHLQIIYYGRERCPARNHDLDRCEICRRFAGPLVKEAARRGPAKAPVAPAGIPGAAKPIKAAKAAKAAGPSESTKALKPLKRMAAGVSKAAAEVAARVAPKVAKAVAKRPAKEAARASAKTSRNPRPEK